LNHSTTIAHVYAFIVVLRYFKNVCVDNREIPIHDFVIIYFYDFILILFFFTAMVLIMGMQFL